MARTIETAQGTIIGRVDRTRRAVVWALVCPGCGDEVELSEAMFTGQAPAGCDCGWSSPVDNPGATGDAPRWFDFTAVFETAPPTGATAKKAAA